MHANIRGTQRRFLLPVASVCALCASLTTAAFGQDTPQSEPEGDAVVNVTDYETVDIAVEGADLSQVLQMLSLQSRRNIITSKNVSATVTANLYDVTFHEALSAILEVNGFVWEEDGNFIYVYTAEEWKIKQDEEREMVTRIVDLNYLSADDALGVATQMLGESGGTAAAQGAVEAGFQPEITSGGEDSSAYNVRLIVTGYPEILDTIVTTLSELDTPPDQVVVEATILQTKMNEANAFGVDFSVIGGFDFTDVMSPLSAVNSLIQGAQGSGSGSGGGGGGGGSGGSGSRRQGFQPEDNEAQAGTSTVGNTAGPAGLKIGIVSNDISVFLRVLDEVTDSVVLARPKVIALNRQRAEVLVGARVGYLSTTATETTTTQTVEFLDTGVQLVFRPFITKDGTIRMELRPSVSEASLRTVTDSNGAFVTIPDELTNEITTNVRIRDGQTIVLGGLFREATSITRRQVPILGDVPIIGNAFRGQDDAVERSEIIFLITPTITHDQLLTDDGEEALAMSELARIGARAGLLCFSREKMTVAHNQKAMEARDAGDTELALYHIRNSLSLNSAQPEVIAMRQQLTGELEMSYEKSLLERVMNRGMHRIGDPDNDQNPEIVGDASDWSRDPLATLDSIELLPIGPSGGDGSPLPDVSECPGAFDTGETQGFNSENPQANNSTTEWIGSDMQWGADACFEAGQATESEASFGETDSFPSGLSRSAEARDRSLRVEDNWLNDEATSSLEESFETLPAENSEDSQTSSEQLEWSSNPDDEQFHGFANDSFQGGNPNGGWWFSRWMDFNAYGWTAFEAPSASVDDASGSN